MHSTTDEHWIENLNWPEIERRIAAGALGILPVGAACKEHGRHLPMNTDFRQASWLASQTATQINALVWPVLGYGYYPSFIDYPGSVSVPDEIFAETARAVIAGMAFSGVKR
ncbi:MAG: creatininase family protein, partial [Pseudomonadota bacterium]